MFKHCIFIAAWCVIAACSHQPDVKVAMGQPTFIRGATHIKGDQDYTIESLIVKIDKIEVNFNHLEYHVHEDRFKNFSVGAKYHFRKTWDPMLVDLGVGFMLAEKDSRNEWLANSYFVADASLAAGIRKAIGKVEVELLYKFQHLSVPWRNDRGQNFDAIEFGVNIPW